MLAGRGKVVKLSFDLNVVHYATSPAQSEGICKYLYISRLACRLRSYIRLFEDSIESVPVI